MILDLQSYTRINSPSGCLWYVTGNCFQSMFWEKVALIFKLLLQSPHFVPLTPSHFVADLCYWVNFLLWVVVPYYIWYMVKVYTICQKFNYILKLWQLYPRKVISDLHVFWKHHKDACQMELFVLFQICLLSLLFLGVKQRAWEIIFWLAFKTKPKQKLVSFPLFHYACSSCYVLVINDFIEIL